MQDFISLPLDVKTLIFSNIRRHKDLKALYKTCKNFYAIIIPRLYHTITLSEQIHVPTLCAFLSPENKGLHHLRHLHIAAETPYTSQNQEKHDNVLHMLANQLPRDTLWSFCTDRARSIPYEVILPLYQRQRKLRTLRFDLCSSLFDWNMPGSISTESISTIQVFVDSHHLLLDGRKCIMAVPVLEHLEIQVDMLKYCRSRKLDIGEELHRATASENIIATLIGEKDDQSSCSNESWETETNPNSTKLRTLRIYGMNLSGVAVHLLQAVDMQQLRSFSVQSCEHEVSLLRILSSGDGGKCERLRNFTIIQSSETQAQIGRDGAINDFLNSFDGLETLIISAPKHAALRPDLSAVAHHERSLRLFYLDCKFDQPDHAYDYEDIELYLTGCCMLEQLALSLPRLPLEPEPFEDSDPEYCFVEALSLLPSVRTFQILNAPRPEDLAEGLPYREVGFVYIDACMKALAKHIFDTLNTVSALVIGRHSSKKVYIRGIPIRQHCFERGRLLDMDGNAVTAAIETSKSALRYLEPASDILDLEIDKAFSRYGQSA